MSQSQLPPGNRSPFEKLVCDGLGYCCPYAFLRLFRSTGHIAARLGQTPRNIRFWKNRYDAGQLECQHRAGCLLPYIRSIGK